MSIINRFIWTAGILCVAALGLLQLPAAEPATNPESASEVVVTNPAEPAIESTPEAEAKEAPTPERRDVGPQKVVGGTIDVKADERTEEVVLVHGTGSIEGNVDGNMVLVLSKARINGRVKGDVVAVMSDISLGPKADLKRQVVRVGGTFEKEPGAKLSSPITVAGDFAGFEWVETNLFKGVLLRPLPPGLGWAWSVAMLSALLHLVVLLLMARPVQACAETLRERPVRSYIVGFLVYLLFLPALVLLSWTVIAIPVLLCALIGAALLGKTVVYRVMGGQLLRQVGLGNADSPLLGWLLGTVFFYLLFMVPILGWVIWFLLVPMGVGAVVTATFEHYQKERGPVSRPPEGGILPQAQYQPLASAVAPEPLGSTILPPLVGSSVSSDATPSSAPASLTGLPPILAGGGALSSAELASLPRVGFWPRLGALVLDLILLGIFFGMLVHFGRFFHLHLDRMGIFLPLVLAYHMALWVWRGATLGSAVLGLKCVRLDGRPLDWQIAAVRAIASFVSLAPCGLGFFWASWTTDRQSWHDIIAGTTIVKMSKPFALI